MYIRFFLQTIPYKTQFVDDKPVFSYADLGFLYLKALEGLPVRALPINGVPPLSSDEHRWIEVAWAFQYAAKDKEPFINVVCGIPNDIRKYWTGDVKNIAIVHTWPQHVNTAQVLEEMGKYDSFVSPKEADVTALTKFGFVANRMTPADFKKYAQSLLETVNG